MSIFELTALVWASSLAAGFLGALTGLGGGVVIVPFLTLVLGIDIRYAIGASLVSVIATSSGAAAAYVKEGFTNIRIGMFLEIATVMGALAGASLAAVTPTRTVAVIFGVVLVVSAFLSSRARRGTRAGGRGAGEKVQGPMANDQTAVGHWPLVLDPSSESPVPHHPPPVPRPPSPAPLKLDGSYPGPNGPIAYRARRVFAGFGLMGVAGALSGLLGIGSGAVKVLALDQAMGLPFKVSTATSNFMIGVTAAASAGVYLNRGYIDPGLAMAVMLGVLPGALVGARFLAAARTKVLRTVFSVVILVLAIEMIYNGLTGRIGGAAP